MKKVDQILLKFEKHAAKILLMVMIVLVFASGVARFLKHPINWAVDMSSFFFAWACFFAVDVAWRENKMMSVDILVKKFSERTQKIIRVVNYIIILAFIVYLIVWGFYLSYKTRYRTFEDTKLQLHVGHTECSCWCNFAIQNNCTEADRRVQRQQEGGKMT